MSKMKIENFINKGVKVLDSLPEGWKFNKGATTAPLGYEWATNGKSHFSDEYQKALIRIWKDDDKNGLS